MSDSSKNTKLITPLAILSYPHLDKPQPSDDGKPPKYSAALIIMPEVLEDPAERAKFDAIQQALIKAGTAKWGEKFEAMAKGDGFKKGLRRDAEAKWGSRFAGAIYFNARSVNQPGLVYSHEDMSVPARPDGSRPPARVPQEKIKEQFYPGSYVRASVSAFAFDNKGGKGVSLGLNNMQWVKDGQRLDNRAAAEDEFAADLSQAPAKLEDLI